RRDVFQQRRERATQARPVHEARRGRLGHESPGRVQECGARVGALLDERAVRRSDHDKAGFLDGDRQRVPDDLGRDGALERGVTHARFASTGQQRDATGHTNVRTRSPVVGGVTPVHPRLSISALSSMYQTFDEDHALWSDLGISLVGLFLPKLQQVGLHTAVDRVRGAGLGVSSVAGVGFELMAPDTWPDRRAELADAVDAAAALDAGCLFVTAGVPGTLGWEECVGALGEAIAAVRDHAAGLGLSVAVEHTNPMRRDIGFIHTLRDMVEVARQLDLGVIVELTNCWSERGVEGTIADGVDTF